MSLSQRMLKTLKDTRAPIEIFNSLTWFFMDAFWMLEGLSWALMIAPLVIISGLVLCFSDLQKSAIFINLSIFSWILMNIAWMISDLGDKGFWMQWSRTCFGIGCICLIFSMATSKSPMQTLSYFRRFRLKAGRKIAPASGADRN